MVIDCEKYPILGFISKRSYHGCLDQNGDLIQLNEKAEALFASLCDNLPETKILSKEFSSAVLKSFSKLTRDEVWNFTDKHLGVILNMPFSWPTKKPISVIYQITGDGTEKHDSTLFFFIGNRFLGHKYQNVSENTLLMVYENGWIKSAHKIFNERFDRNLTYGEAINELDSLLYMNLIATINFIKYAEVETKLVLPKQKEKIYGEKVLNNSEVLVNYYNSTWFTNIVRSEGFSVSGHFRLQPCKKDGQWTKELIWIDDFQKHGYTRKAGILTQNEK